MKKEQQNRILEPDLILPAVKLIKDYPGITTTELIIALEKNLVLSNEDKAINTGRKDTKFSQEVRNLVSHKNKRFFTYVKVTKISRREGGSSFVITNAGEAYLKKEENAAKLDGEFDLKYQVSIQSCDPYTSKNDLEFSNNREPHQVTIKGNKKWRTDPRISKTVLSDNEYKCEFSSIDGVSHITFKTKLGNEYVEGHHLIPMSAQTDFNLNLDRSSNIISLCPICHKQLHYGSLEEKVKKLKPLFDMRISKLSSESIDITFEKLVNKYYK